MIPIEIALLIVPLLPLVAVVILARYWRSGSTSLTERTVLAGRDLLVSSFVAALAADDLFDWNWQAQWLGLMFGLMLLLIALPSAVWLGLYWRGAFQ